MLAIAISTFFALAFLGAVTIIGMMFFHYWGRITCVIQNELRLNSSEAICPSVAYRHRTVKAPQLMTQHRSLQPAPLRAAA